MITPTNTIHIQEYDLPGLHRRVRVSGNLITYDGNTIPIKWLRELIKAFDYVSQVVTEGEYSVVKSVEKKLDEDHWVCAQRGTHGDTPLQLHKAEIWKGRSVWPSFSISATEIGGKNPPEVEVFRELLKHLEKEQ